MPRTKVAATTVMVVLTVLVGDGHREFDLVVDAVSDVTDPA
ncbi:hypothetical protein [Steroidobacter cummioxidans]|nr:hypothetical protein [Steroidobacter cummioxidans]